MIKIRKNLMNFCKNTALPAILLISIFYIALFANVASAETLNPARQDISFSINDTTKYYNVKNSGDKVFNWTVNANHKGPGGMHIVTIGFWDEDAGNAPTTRHGFSVPASGKLAYRNPPETGSFSFSYDTRQRSCGRVQIDGSFIDERYSSYNDSFLFYAIIIDYGVDCQNETSHTPAPAPTPTPTPVTPPAVSINAPSCSNENYSAQISWAGGINNNMVIFVDDDTSFSSSWSKLVSGVNGSTVIPGGINPRLPGMSNLTLQPGVRYYTFLQLNTIDGPVQSWVVNRCATPTPTPTPAPTPTPTPTPAPVITNNSNSNPVNTSTNTNNNTFNPVNTININTGGSGYYPYYQYPTYNPVSVNISADRTSLNYGESTIIRWTPSNATYCTGTGGSNGWAGSRSSYSDVFSTGPLYTTTTYTIYCNNSSASSDSRSVTVYVGNQQIIAPVYTPVYTPVTVRETTVVNRTPATSLVLMSSSVDRNQPIIPTIDNSKPRPGDEVNYTINYQNAGNASVSGLNLRVSLPFEVDYIYSNPSNPTISANTLSFNLGTLKAGGQGTVNIRTRVRNNIPAGTYLNFPATLSFTNGGRTESVNANVSAQVWGDNMGDSDNIFSSLSANVFGGVGFLPISLLGWLFLIAVVLMVMLLAKHFFGIYGLSRNEVHTTTSHH